MRRRSFLAASLAPLACAAAEKKPNIVIVLMDDMGQGCFPPYAQKLEVRDFDPAFVAAMKEKKVEYTPEQALDFARRAMPTLHDMSKAGVVFRNAFSGANLCAPARSAILTGRMSPRAGLYENADVEATGIVPGTVLAAQLQKAGYATALIGKYHVGPRNPEIRTKISDAAYTGSVIESHHPLNNGFDYWFGYNHFASPFYNAENVYENRTWAGKQNGYNTEVFANKALAFMDKARSDKKPFFVQICFQAVHGPLGPKSPDRYFEKFPSKSFPLTNFYAHLNAVDTAVARIRETLGDEWRNTLFFFASDNGAPSDVANTMPGNAPYVGTKGSYYQGGIRVPLMMHWPEKVKGGQWREELVATYDMMPTALDAAGIAPPKDLDGRSLLGLVNGKETKLHEHLVWAGIHARTWGFHRDEMIGEFAERRRNESPAAWVVTDGKYLLRYVTATPPKLFRDAPDGAPAKYELFDVREDPKETRNLIHQIPQVAEELKAQFFRTAKGWKPSTKWRPDRWREMMAAK